MALKDLQSDLSWYGTKSPGPYTPPTDSNDTRFSLVNKSVPTVDVGGYDFQGVASLAPVSRIAGDSFIIDDKTHSDRGFASRGAQLGNGTKFPIGPFGQVHEFDKVRTGFTPDSKYEDTYGKQTNNSENKNVGLANTYTAKSPIDDMYNKFKVREEAYNPGYIKHPLILRGIQRDDNSDPQRWGLGDTTAGAISATLDLPRGGILTSVERAAVDTARISKFLVSPNGLGFLVRRFGYHLMNPNLENKLGIAAGLPATQLYNPTSAPIAALTSMLGIRPKHHGIPLITGGILGGGGPNEYSSKKKIQDLTFGLGDKTSKTGLGFSGYLNRLNNLYTETFTAPFNVLNIPGAAFATMTGPKGPGSILGIGVTSHNRADALTSLKNQSNYGALGVNERDAIEAGTYKYGADSPVMGNPLSYQNFRGNTGNSWTIQQVDDGENFRGSTKLLLGEGTFTPYKTDSLKNIVTGGVWSPGNSFHEPKSIGTEVGNAQSELPAADQSGPADITTPGYYKTLAYDALVRREDKKIIRSFSGDAFGALKAAGDGATEYDDAKTLEGKYKYVNYGPSSREAGKIVEQPDPINNLAFGEDYGDNADLINFKFTPLRLTDTAKDTEVPIIFRAYISNLSDNFMPNWEENQDQGRADAKILLSGWSRTISVDFMVAIQSKAELANCWQKLDELARLTYPVYVAGKSFTGTYCKVTIGDLYKGQAMYVTDLSYDWDNETPWELDNGTQVPYYTNVSMTLGWIGTQRPEYTNKAFSLNSTT